MTTKAEQVDMSPAAVAARLEQFRALYRLVMSLPRIRPGEPLPVPTAPRR